MNTEQQSSNKLSFEECLREEFLVNTQNYPKEYHQLFNTKFNRAKRRFDDVSNAINEPIDSGDICLHPYNECCITNEGLQCKVCGHVIGKMDDKNNTEPIKDEELKKEAKSLYLDNYNDYPMVNADESFMDGIELGCWGMNRKYSQQYAASQVNNIVEDKWISVDTPPKEGGRYWCYVEEVNDLGICHYQWNCSYHEVENRWSEDKTRVEPNVRFWQPLPNAPIK